MRQIRFQVQADSDAVFLCGRSVKIDKLADKNVEVFRNKFLVADPRELQEIIKQLVQLLSFLLNLLQLLEHPHVAWIVAIFDLFDEQFQIEAHRRQRIPDLMRESARECGDL